MLKAVWTAFAALCIFCFGFSQIPEAEKSSARPAIEVIPQEKLLTARDLLSREGIALPAAVLVGIAFDPAIPDNTGLVVITLDRNMDPVKNVFKVSSSFYSNLTGTTPVPAPAEAGETSSAAPIPPAALSVKERRETGRTYFIVSTAARTLTIYPAGFATMLGDSADSRTITGLSLLTFGASLYGSYQFTKDMELGYGRVAMMNYGGELATTYSFLASRLLYGSVRYKPTVHSNTFDIYDMNSPTGRDTTFYDTTESKTPGKIFAVGTMLGFPLGIYLGSRVNFAGNHQYGNTDIMRFFGRSAWLYGFLLPLYGSGKDKYDYNLAASCLTMGLIPSGFYLGRKLVREHDYSSGRGFFIETAGIMGGLTGFLVPMLWNADFDNLADRRIWISSILAGHVLGTTLGFKFKEKNSYTFFQGGFMAFSAVCGGAIGLSVPFLAKADSSNPYIIAGLVGGWGGLIAGEYLAKSLFEVTAHDQKQSRVDISLPIAYTWPALMQKTAGINNRNHMRDPAMDIVRARITF